MGDGPPKRGFGERRAGCTSRDPAQTPSQGLKLCSPQFLQGLKCPLSLKDKICLWRDPSERHSQHPLG